MFFDRYALLYKNGSLTWVKVQDAEMVYIKGWEDVLPGLFVRKSDETRLFFVVEARTGRSIGPGQRTKKEAVMQATLELNKHTVKSILRTLKKCLKSDPPRPDFINNNAFIGKSRKRKRGRRRK
jgi:hypothetical protein